MEDVVLSRLLNQKGKTTILNEKVPTDARKFFDDGMLRYSWRVIFCRGLYAFGISTQRIYNYYYYPENKTL